MLEEVQTDTVRASRIYAAFSSRPEKKPDDSLFKPLMPRMYAYAYLQNIPPKSIDFYGFFAHY